MRHTAVVLGTLFLAPLPASAQTPDAQGSAASAAASSGLSVAWLDLEEIVQASAEGKIANAKVQALTQRKSNEIGERTKQLQASQQRLQAGGTVLNDAARLQLERDIERLNIDIQRMQQDAQAEVQELQVELQAEFQQKLMPVIEALVKERGVTFLFSRLEAGIVYADPATDLTMEIIRRFDAAASAPSAAPASAAPAQPPPAAPAATPPPGN
jgi:outer membrane protein